MTSDLEFQARVLVVEPDAEDFATLSAVLSEAGHFVVSAADRDMALQSIRKDDPEVVLVAADSSSINAYQFCERIKSHPSSRSIPVLLITSRDDSPRRNRGLEVGADDFLCRPVDAAELLARVKTNVRLKRLTDQVDTTESIIFGMASLTGARSPGQNGSTVTVVELVESLGQALGLPDEELETLRKSAVLNDIGKIAVREEVLLKAGTLTDSERNEIRIQPEVAERICRPMRDADLLLPVLRHCRERWDGGGYPDGLSGEAIPQLARILSIADAYEAMLSPRPYRPALSPEQARESLRTAAGTQFDPDMVEQFLALVE